MVPQKSVRVLMVDDDEDDFILTRKLLEEIEGTKYELHWISNFEAAFANLNSGDYDIILVDYYFGARTGVEILSEAYAEGCTTPMILLTGLGDRDVDFAAMQAGAADYLEKNELTARMLERTIRYAISAGQAREALLEKSILLQATLDNTDSGIAAFDSSKRLIAWNDRFLSMLGLERGFEHLDGFEGRAVPEVGLLSRRVSECLKLGNIPEEGLSEHIAPNGRVLEVRYNKSRDDGRVIVCIDVTDRKRSEEMLIKSKETAELANRAKTEFLANASHELRTPLNAIIGFSELMILELNGPVGNDKYTGYIGDINQSGEHLLSLINDILDVSKIESGKFELHEKQVEIARIIKSCLRMIRERAEVAQISITHEVDPDLMHLWVDERAIKQILLNLLSNSVKFTPAKGKVRLTIEKTDEGGVCLSVSDTGIGIAPEDLGKVFEPFGQAGDTANRGVEGTGLGLPLVKALTELIGGSLSLESSPHVGTTVNVYLPQEHVLHSKTVKKTGTG